MTDTRETPAAQALRRHCKHSGYQYCDFCVGAAELDAFAADGHRIQELKARVATLEAARAEAFKAGFVAHPEAEAPVFQWSFNPATCAAGDRWQSAYDAWLTASRPPA